MAVASLTRTRKKTIIALCWYGSARHLRYSTLIELPSRWLKPNCVRREDSDVGRTFKYEPNYALGRHNFRLLRQLPYESAAQFIYHLSQQSKPCKFSNDEEHIVEQLVEGVVNSGSQRILLDKKRVENQAGHGSCAGNLKRQKPVLAA